MQTTLEPSQFDRIGLNDVFSQIQSNQILYAPNDEKWIGPWNMEA